MSKLSMCIVCAVMCVCITYAAIYFNASGLLWFLVMPFLLIL